MKNYRKGIKNSSGKRQKALRAQKIKADARKDFHEKVKIKDAKKKVFRNDKNFK